ncbi:MAG: T9SS type A sorting domain-containing protein [Flavobacteriales bacterium]|nr:T9SS type A sorting domain-containing protein [Flavobacteriales bacterium]
MYRLALTLIIGTVSYWISGQSTFMQSFYGTGTAQAEINELSSGNFRIGLARQSGTSLFDPNGDILQSRNYAVDTFLVLQSIKRYTDNEFFFVGGYQRDSCSMFGEVSIPHTYPLIGRMDSLGNILNAQYYILNSENCSNTAGDLEVMSDGGAIAWGIRHDRFYLLRVDNSGEPTWGKNYGTGGVFQFLKELPSGDLLAGINMMSAGAVVARLDPSGNMLWCKSYIRPRGMVHDAVIVSDDTFYITGTTDSTALNLFTPLPFNYQPKLFLMNLNGMGEVQWCRGYDGMPNPWHSGSGSKIVNTHDGSFVVVATLGEPDYNWFHSAVLMKLDTNGDTLWTRSVMHHGFNHYAKDLLATADGGYLYNGQIWGELPVGQANFAFLYKTDADGHLPCIEHHHSITIVDLFPVDSAITLTSVDGAVPGPAFINETIYPPIDQYDGCDIMTNLPRTNARGRSFNIRPNPNTGHFTVQFPDPLQAESYYSVYDTMGKLLFQRRLPTGATQEEVDLSGFSPGTYVLRFTDRDGVCYERVVLE